MKRDKIKYNFFKLMLKLKDNKFIDISIIIQLKILQNKSDLKNKLF